MEPSLEVEQHLARMAAEHAVETEGGPLSEGELGTLQNPDDWAQDAEIKRLRLYAESLEEDVANAKSLTDRGDRRRIRYAKAIMRLAAALKDIAALKQPHPKCRDAHAAIAIAEKALRAESDLVLYRETGVATFPDSPDEWDGTPTPQPLSKAASARRAGAKKAKEPGERSTQKTIRRRVGGGKG